MTKLGRFSTLEIQLNAEVEPELYRATLRFQAPGADDVTISGPHRVALPEAKLNLLKDQMKEYRRLLTQSVFESGKILQWFQAARLHSDVQDAPLRIRIVIGDDATRLQTIRWEALGDPDAEEVRLAVGERAVLSRYLRRTTQRGGRESGSGRLTSAVFFANPQTRERQPLGFPNLNMAGERQFAEEFLGRETRMRPFANPGEASRKNLFEELPAGCDILYLACHGSLVEDEPQLYLEGADGDAEVVRARDLIELIRGMQSPPPRLVVLASCQSAGGGQLSNRDDDGFLASLGARLVDAGVMAVVGMAGNISDETSQLFTRSLFQSVLIDGQIERAVSVARRAIGGRHDWWMPVLLLASESGQLWPRQRIREEFKGWDTILTKIKEGKCTPILGSEIVSPFANREFKEYLRDHLDPEDTKPGDELSRVAQQFKFRNRKDSVGDEYKDFLLERMLEDAVDINTDDPDEAEGDRLLQAISRWGATPKAGRHLKMLRALSSIPFPLYLTTNGDNLLQDSLSALKKTPETEICPWWAGGEEFEKVQNIRLDLRGTRERPVVYHLFGHLSHLPSVVLTEDDFFDHLMWVSRNPGLIPKDVKSRVQSTSLLFLGFQLEDWEFRVLLRGITKLQASEQQSKQLNVAVQVPYESDEDTRRQVQRALEEFFRGSKVNLSIYWGSVEEFILELIQRWGDRQKRVLAAAQGSLV